MRLSLSLSKYKVVFFGNDSFSLPNLIHISRSPAVSSIKAVVTSDACPVMKFCLSKQIPCLLIRDVSLERFDEFTNNSDLGIVASFGQMIPEVIMKQFRIGMLNIHPSLIPRWRGSSPIIYSILHSDSEVGVTIMTLSMNKFDHGRILTQESRIINPQIINRLELTKFLSNLGGEMICKILEGDLEYYLSRASDQKDVGHETGRAVTIAKKFNNDKCKINWTEQSSFEIDRIYRAFLGIFDMHANFQTDNDDMLPVHLYGLVPGNRLNIDDRTMLEKSEHLFVPGSVKFNKGGSRTHLLVKCALRDEFDWLGISHIVINGRRLKANDFMNGFVKKRNRIGLFG